MEPSRVGKTKTEIKAASKALNIQHSTLKKLTGTRFVGHHWNAYTNLLISFTIWPAIDLALKNVASDCKTRPETKAKVQGFLKNNFRSHYFLCLVCSYLDILKIITPILKIFESKSLIVWNCTSCSWNCCQHKRGNWIMWQGWWISN